MAENEEFGFDDEFDYLDDEGLETSTVDAPMMKGSQDKETISEEEKVEKETDLVPVYIVQERSPAG